MEKLFSYLYQCLGIISHESGYRIGLILWCFLFLELPRYALTNLIILLQSVLPSSGKAGQEEYLRELLQNPPLVSLIVPSYNEEKHLPASINSFLAQSYPRLEIIVVDDGSNDHTPQLCATLARQGKIIYLRNHLRGGKSSALNSGLAKAQGEFIVTADADTILDRDAITQILAGFADPEVGAVSGNLRPQNTEENLLTRLQAIHYLIAINMGRRFNAWANMLLIVSGAFGAFRRRLLEQAGGWDKGPGEDADMTLKIKRSGSNIAFRHQAVAYTHVPETTGGYIRQQLRWNHSLVAFYLRKHSWTLNPFQVGFDAWAWAGALDVLFYQFLLSYSFAAYLIWLVVFHRPLAAPILAATSFIYLIDGYAEFLMAWLASDRKSEDTKLFIYIPLYALFVCYFLRFIRLWAYTGELLWQPSLTDPHIPQKVQNAA